MAGGDSHRPPGPRPRGGARPPAAGRGRRRRGRSGGVGPSASGAGAAVAIRPVRSGRLRGDAGRPHRSRPGQLQRHPPVDPRRAGGAGVAPGPGRDPGPGDRRGPEAHPAVPVAAGRPAADRDPPPGHGGGPVGAAGAAVRGGRQPVRDLPAAADGGRAAGPHLHQAGPDHQLRRGDLPGRAGRRVQAVPRPGARRAVPVVREVVEADLGRPLDEVFRWVDRTPLAAASIAQVHAATLRTGERVVVKVQRTHRRPAGARRPAGDGVAGAQAGGAHPHRGAGQPARPWSSCSPRRSPRSSTSGSRPRTCSTWPGRSPSWGSATT